MKMPEMATDPFGETVSIATLKAFSILNLT